MAIALSLDVRRLISLALPSLALCIALDVRAQPENHAGPLAIEAQVGEGGPLGDRLAIALSYDRGERFAAGVGVGAADFREHLPPLGLFGRVRLLRSGPLAVGLGFSLSRAHHEESEWSAPPAPPYDGAMAARVWEPAYRADLTAVVELMSPAWSLRLEPGLGRRLNDPHCTFTTYPADYRTPSTSGPCDQAPPAYHWNQPSNPIQRSLTLTVEHRFELFSATPADLAPASGRKSPDTARRLSLYSTLLPTLVGTALLSSTLGYNRHGLTALGAATLVLGVSLGPSVGYAYAGEPARGWSAGALRLAGFGLLAAGAVAYADGNFCEYCEGSASTTAFALVGLAALGGTLVSAVYDIVHAPDAARRENARRRLSDVALVPLSLPAPTATGQGLALAGRF